MTVHEFGKENKKILILIHPSIVMWDYFEYVIPLLDKDFHLVIPSIPGYNPDRKDDFTSVEEIAAEMEAWLINRSISEVECVYGCFPCKQITSGTGLCQLMIETESFQYIFSP